jgi:hypothetical protein
MGGSVDVSRVRHCGRMPRVVPVAGVRAGLFAVLGTGVAGTVHHLAFDSSPSWSMRTLAALLLFGVALPGAGHDKPLVRQLLLAFASQAAVGYWFVRADDAISVPAHEVWPSSVHAGWAVVAGHVLLTVLSSVLLRGMDTCRRRVLRAAGRELLRRLFVPVCAPLEFTAEDACLCVLAGEDRDCPAVVLLADSVVRRGPPLSSLSLAA